MGLKNISELQREGLYAWHIHAHQLRRMHKNPRLHTGMHVHTYCVHTHIEITQGYHTSINRKVSKYAADSSSVDIHEGVSMVLVAIDDAARGHYELKRIN